MRAYLRFGLSTSRQIRFRVGFGIGRAGHLKDKEFSHDGVTGWKPETGHTIARLGGVV